MPRSAGRQCILPLMRAGCGQANRRSPATIGLFPIARPIFRPMPNAATHPRRAPSARWPLRSLLGLAATLALFFYACTPSVPREMCAWHLALARQQSESNPPLALAHVNGALLWSPADPQALFLRAILHEGQGDDEQALAAIAQALQVKELGAWWRQNLLALRIEILQRSGKHAAAIKDAHQMVAIGPVASDLPQQIQFNRAVLYNQRAYTIARAAAEQQATPAQMALARDDMQRSFALLSLERKRYTRLARELPLGYWRNEISYLDTLGYVELFAGDHRAALRDLNRALQMSHTYEELARRQTLDPQELSADLRKLRAVLLHHRGEALLALGNRLEGSLCMKLAQQEGYSRAQGNW